MMRTIRFTARVALAVAIVLMASGALASVPNGVQGPHVMGAVAVGSGWQVFGWGGTLPAPATQNPITFSCGTSQGCSLKITDVFVCGDVFEVKDGATVIGTTSTPSCGTNPAETNPDIAFAGTYYSKGTFPLAPGPHSITLTTVAGLTSGEAYLRVDNGGGLEAIPTASTTGLALLAVLIAAAGFVLVRRLV